MTAPTCSPPPRSPKRRRAEPNRCLPGQAEALSSQQLATSFLVQGCERALVDLRCSLGQAGTPHEVRVGLGAAELLAQVLAGWRDTLCLLRTAGAGDAKVLPGVDSR